MLTINKMSSLVMTSGGNRSYLEYFNERLGHVPNLFIAMMYSDNALLAYYPFHSRKTSLSKRESEAITLVVSQQNKAMYCLSVHTMIAKLNGFSDDEILKLRKGVAPFNSKLDALVKLTGAIAKTPDHVDDKLLNTFFAEGYTKEQLIDAIQVVGDSFITNLTGKTFDVPIDFPLVKEL